MPLYTHIETGFASDIHPADTAEDYLKKFSQDISESWNVVECPDGTLSGAAYDAGAFTNPVAATISPPQPNNPGNPYFGKKALQTKDFFAIAGQVLGARYPRLRNDVAFLWVYDVLTKIEIVDVDDRAGQFLKIVHYLTTTNAADSQPLMSNSDVTSIMAVWPSN